MAKKKSKFRVYAFSAIGLLFLIPFFILFSTTSNTSMQTFKVHKNWNRDSLDLQLDNQLGLVLPFGFSNWAKFLGYGKVKPCFFIVDPNTTAWKLIKNLRMNRKQAVNVVITSGISKESFVDIVTSKLDISPMELHLGIQDASILKQFYVNDTTWPLLVIPNTYNISMSIDLEGFLERKRQESDKFWTNERLEKAKNQKLSKLQVVTIASIVNKESNKEKEYNNIAGVYINRFRIGMKLQADPTVNFAKGKDERVVNVNIESPYNTYLHEGLPPGPICIPSIAAIDAVLNYTKHDYLYFCAKSDFTGYHIFEKNYEKHKKNARLFISALNREEKKRDSRK